MRISVAVLLAGMLAACGGNSAQHETVNQASGATPQQALVPPSPPASMPKGNSGRPLPIQKAEDTSKTSTQSSKTSPKPGEEKPVEADKIAVAYIKSFSGNTVTLRSRPSGGETIVAKASDFALPLPVYEVDQSTLNLKIQTRLGARWIDPSDVGCCVPLHDGPAPPVVLDGRPHTLGPRAIAR